MKFSLLSTAQVIYNRNITESTGIPILFVVQIYYKYTITNNKVSTISFSFLVQQNYTVQVINSVTGNATSFTPVLYNCTI